MHDLLRLLADQTRVRILAALEGEELAVNEIADVLEMSQSRVSNHLRLLRGADLIEARRDGSWTFYRNAVDADADQGALWAAVLGGLRGDAALSSDARRRKRVLDRRRERSRAHFARSNGSLDDLALAAGTLREEIVATAAPRDLVVVDAGCGDGGLTEALALRFHRVFAFDHAPERLAAARARVPFDNVTFAEGEVDALPIAAGACDLVFLSLVLHHVPRIVDAMREAWRVLRPGGRVIVADLAPHEEEAMRRDGGDLRLGIDPDQLVADLSDAGFTDPRVRAARDRVVAGAAELEVILADGTKTVSVRRRTQNQSKSRKSKPQRARSQK